MARGFVYVLVNSSIPGLVKIGCTTRPPAERVAELSSATGVATPFVLAYEQEFADCELAERDIHAELDRCGLRVASNREFFRCSPSDAIRTLILIDQHATAPADDEAVCQQRAQTVQALVEEGDGYYRGEGNRLQDIGEAVRLYRQAARLGSALAEERLGAIYARVCGTRRVYRKRAVLHLKAGAQLGNPYCWLEMAMLYARESHERNCAKSFTTFTEQMTDRQNPRFINGCCRYIAACYDHKWMPAQLPILCSVADPVMDEFIADLDRTSFTQHDRDRITELLRHTYSLLRPKTARPPRAGWLTWLVSLLNRPHRIHA